MFGVPTWHCGATSIARSHGNRTAGLFSMLVLIDENPGIAQIEIAVQLAIDKATIVGLIRLLQKQGWIERRRSRADRRRQDLYLTTQGRHELATLRREMLEHEARFTNLFSRQEFDAIL